MMRISAVLACHNEERFIQAWLEETSAYADEILIAVHAPTDSTADIIARFKPNSPVPIRCEWFPAQTVARFGFSLMKNEMIARATGDWVTSIDADEEIGLAREELHQILDAAMGGGWSAVSLQWAQHPRLQDRTDDWTMDRRDMLRRAHTPVNPPVRKWKIFRNHAGFWWQGLIHEELARRGGGAWRFSLDSDAFLHHYAYLNHSVPAWKGCLYAYLICRIRDCPRLRIGTNPWWYEGGFLPNEAGIRAGAALFEARRHEWFPEIPGRDL
jgi:glycosyltransferase involved in cell wall biosynthesis